MHVHPEELRWAQVNEKHLQFEPLTRGPGPLHHGAGQRTAPLV